MAIPYKNPTTPLQFQGSLSIDPTQTFGNTFSVYNIGGYMEVGSLSDLSYTIPTGTTGTIEYSGNTIPIEFLKGGGQPYSPDVLTLYSDNISSGRRRLGMLVYVHEEDQVYQFHISGYTSLFTAATASTNCVSISEFGTLVRNNTPQGQSFINAWTASTIEDVNGYTSETATWRKFNSGSSGSTVSGNYLPLSGGTLTGGLVANNGLTASTISQTTYIDFTTGTTNPSVNGGRVFFDQNEQSLSYYSYLNNPVVVNTGQQLYLRVFNNTLSAITKGSVVSVISQSNGLPAITLSVNSTTGTTGLVAGLAAETIPPGTSGLTITNGILSGLTISSSYTPGDTIYLDYLIPGEFSNNVPNFPLSARTNEIGYIIQTGTTTGKVYVNINNENIQLSLTDLQRNVLEGNVISTGVFAFSGLSLVSASGTTFNIAPVQAWFVENTSNYLKPTVQYITYSGASNVSATYVNTATQTYVLLTSGATILQQTTFPTPQQRRENVYLGKLGHANKTFLINAFNEPDFDVSPLSQLRDMFAPIRLINGGIYPSVNGANLTFNTSAGVLYGLGIGWITNPLNPDSLSVSGNTPCTFQYRTQTGGTASNTTLIDPTKWDVGGVETTIVGIKSTNQRIYLVQNGTFRLQYGQTEYNQLSAAIAGIQTETFTTFSNFRDNAILIGILSVTSNCTDLSDTTKAQFFLVSKFGETVGAAGGVATTTLQQAYNNSAEPEILINSTLDGLSIRNGTGNADNVTSLLQGQNTSGTTTSFIRADGAFSGTSIFGTGLSATTISATTYQNLPTDVRVTGATYSNNNFTFTNNTGGTFSVLFNTVTGLTINGNLTVTGNTSVKGLTATTISATTYQNLPQSVSGTGTADYVTKWDGVGLGLVDSLIYSSGSFVGINATSPIYGENISFQTGKGLVVDDAYIATTNTSLSLAGGYDYSTWGTAGGEIAIGTRGPLNKSQSSGNIGIGDKALSNNLTGSNNIAIGGSQTLLANDSGSDNLAIGNNSMIYNDSGINNIALGSDSLYNNLGNRNVAIGVGAGYTNGNYDRNVYIGYAAGYSNDGSSNIFIGDAAGYGDTSSSNRLIIGDTIYGDLNTKLIGINQPTPTTTLDVNGNTNISGDLTVSTVSATTQTISGTKGSVITNGNTSTAFLTISGSNTVGGTGYTDFIRVTNTAAGVTNPTKTIRVNNTGGIEFINNAYNAQTLTLTDGGVLSVGGGNTAVTSNNDPSANYLSFNNNFTAIYDDGNTHIHSRSNGGSMWINTNNGAIILGNQSPVLGGGAASGIIMGSGSTTTRAFANIYGGKTYTIGTYGYLATIGAGTGAGTTATYGLYVQQRVEATEFDATSDERLKNIHGEIELNDAIKLVKNIKPIKFTWKDKETEGIKSGYSAQQVVKSGFNHLIGHIKNEDLIETTDDEGFTSPEGFQLTMNYDQVTPYHGVVIKHLLEEIEKLKEEIKELKNKVG